MYWGAPSRNGHFCSKISLKVVHESQITVYRIHKG